MSRPRLCHLNTGVGTNVLGSSFSPQRICPDIPSCKSYYDRHAVLACGCPSVIWLTGVAVTVPVGACGCPSEMVDTGAAVPVGACGCPSEMVDTGAAVPVGACGCPSEMVDTSAGAAVLEPPPEPPAHKLDKSNVSVRGRFLLELPT
jgi:hypothetical protein